MHNVRLFLALITILLAPAVASAVPITITGNSTGTNATATGTLTLSGGVLTLTLTNTSAFDGRITGLGFDLVTGDFSGNSAGLNGFSGANSAGFTFVDGSLGNIPQFNSALLDFGWITGNSGNFNGGSPNGGLAPAGTLIFTASGNFGSLTAAEIASGLYVRFQRIGPRGQDSDVGPGVSVTEPASLLLFGSGLIAAAAAVRRRKARQ